jgi:diguanylate cyclase (GGDEF)-like protein
VAEACIASAAAALQTLRALALAKERAIRDGLTGVFNRRLLDEMLPKMVDQSLRQETPLSVLLFDIDHFKRFNDEHGHEVGDRVLMAFSRCVRDSIRNGDVLARYGGEEFVVILPNTPHETAKGLAERLRQKVQDLLLPTPEFPKGCRITVSIGVASIPEHGREGDALLNCADQALYVAKGTGRNRVVGRERPRMADSHRMRLIRCEESWTTTWKISRLSPRFRPC